MANPTPTPTRDKPNQDLPGKGEPDRPDRERPEHLPAKPGEGAEPKRGHKAKSGEEDQRTDAEREHDRSEERDKVHHLRNRIRALLEEVPPPEGLIEALEPVLEKFDGFEDVNLRQRHAQNPVMWPDFAPAQTSTQATSYHTAVVRPYTAHVPDRLTSQPVPAAKPAPPETDQSVKEKEKEPAHAGR